MRIALQEVDRGALISGGLFLAIGGTAMFLVWRRACCALDSGPVGAGVDARATDPRRSQSGSGWHQLAHWRTGVEGPFLPQTLEGVMKTVRALMGRA